MILYIDRFMDTHTKRYHLFVLLLLGMFAVFIIPYIILAFTLLNLDTYDSVYALLRTPIIQMVYIARVVLDVISNANLNIITIAYILISNVNCYEIFVIVFFILAYPILEKKKIFSFVLLLFCFQLLSCCICVMLGAQAMSLSGAIIYLRIIGGILCFANIILWILVICYFIKHLKQYVKALQYNCVVIKEPMY